MLEFEFFDFLNEECKDIREKVFVIEQGFNEEFDTYDNRSIHLLVRNNGESIATSRAFKESEGVYHIGRVAVLKDYRRCGIGSKMLEAFEKELLSRGAKEIVLGSQLKAKTFYEKNGYIEYGDIFLDEGCPHILMKKQLIKSISKKS